MRYFMQLSYRGEGFLGWQIQPQGPTVQGTIEDALSRLLRCATSITGAGRTDTGVNARMMIAHFDASQSIDIDDLIHRLNAMVGRNIAIQKIWPVPDNAHARFDATERTYRYFVTTSKKPFAYPLAWQAPTNIDFAAMNNAAELLLGRRDFTSFSKLHTQVKTNICDLRAARWIENENELISDLWWFEISADRFLRNMVRAVVGTLIDVGRHKIPADAITEILEKENRGAAGTSMPATPLFLWNIKYPTIFLPDQK